MDLMIEEHDAHMLALCEIAKAIRELTEVLQKHDSPLERYQRSNKMKRVLTAEEKNVIDYE